MHDLQLVGLTTDRRGLIFRPRAGARSDAAFVVPVTADLVALVAELAQERGEAESPDPDPPVEPAEAVAAAEAASKPRSQLSVRDIQARLRAGEPAAQVAFQAGVDEDWIERFAPPIRAEQRRIVDRALEHHLERPRSAPSAVPLRRAVGMALAEKGIAFTVAAFDAAWSAHLLGHDRWAVSFTYRHRGRDRTVTWTYDAAADELTATDRTAGQLGYVAPGAAADDDGLAIDGIIGDPDAATKIGAAGAGERSSTKRSPKKATAKPAQKKAAPATRSAAKKAARKKAPAKKATTAKKAARKKPAAKKAAVKKPAAKKAAAKKAATAKRSEVKEAAPKKAATAQEDAVDEAAVDEAVRAEEASGQAVPSSDTVPEQVAPGPQETFTARLRDQPPPQATTGPGPDERVAPPASPVAGRPGQVSVAEAPLAGRPPVSNGRAGDERGPSAPEDPASARRARAAERNAPTVHFRSGSAAPVHAAGEPAPDGQTRRSAEPAPDSDRPRADPSATNGSARPATRRRRQLRAR